MAKQIYRKSLLERMSSPEQLDKMIVITPPFFWLALLGGLIIISVVLVWSIVGRLPVKLQSTGIVVQDEGAYILASDTGGIVTSVEVEEGDYVEEGDVVLTLSDEAVLMEMENLNKRRDQVAAVTIDSIGDVVTADNRELINLKTQLTTVGLGAEQQKAMLDVYEDELEELMPRLSNAKAELDCAKAEYYNYIYTIKDTDVELDYSEAQSDYSRAASYYDQAAITKDNTMTTYRVSLNIVVNSLKKKPENIDKIDALDAVDPETAPDKLSDTVLQFMDSINPALYSNLESLYNQYIMAAENFSDVEADYKNAKQAYETARNRYEGYSDYSAAFSTEKERVATIYNEKTSDYNNLYSQKVNLEAQIASLEGQLKAAELGADSQQEAYEMQFEATRDAILNSLDMEIERYEYSHEKTNVKATVPGTVINLKVTKGMALAQGGEYATVQQQAEGNVIVCYIPITTGKKVQPGMEVVVCPTMVNQQEYGHMQAEVIDVDGYVATTLDMRTVLGDDTLVQSFLQNGPVIGVTCKMRMDESTASGYWWSNKKGASLIIPEGTIVTADIVTEEKAPITMIIPLLKEKLSMDINSGVGSK